MNASPLIRMSHATTSGLVAGLDAASAWCAGHFSRAPITSTGVVLVTLGYLLATGNALYGQSGAHPAPMFGSSETVPPAIAPVEAVPGLDTEPLLQTGSIGETPAAPAPQPQPQPAPAAQQAPAPETASRTVGNEDVAQLQEKLRAMGLFDGTVDGFYGPKTADAIRAFEERFGLPRNGAITPEIVQAVENAPLDAPQLSQAPQPAPEPEATLTALNFEPLPETAEAAPQPAAAETPDQAVMEMALAHLGGEAVDEDGPAASPSMIESLLALASRQPAPTPTHQPSLDTELVSAVQRGLAQLGFLRAPVTGIAGDETALAIRNFETFHNFQPTGSVSYALLDKLIEAGATL